MFQREAAELDTDRAALLVGLHRAVLGSGDGTPALVAADAATTQHQFAATEIAEAKRRYGETVIEHHTEYECQTSNEQSPSRIVFRRQGAVAELNQAIVALNQNQRREDEGCDDAYQLRQAVVVTRLERAAVMTTMTQATHHGNEDQQRRSENVPPVKTIQHIIYLP